MTDRYLCDPRKNVECTKESCLWKRGNKYGECFCTTKEEYGICKIPEPISDHDYRELKKNVCSQMHRQLSKQTRRKTND